MGTINTESLYNTINNISALLEQMTLTPKPSYNVNGRSMDWAGYFEMLTKQREALKRQLAQDEPFEQVTLGR